jgi:DNA polymerase III alpha subunit (gram-positive type)
MVMSTAELTCVVDLETTGFDVVGCDVLVASFLICDKNYKILAEKTFYAAPESQKYWGGEEIHGIKFDDASVWPTARKTCIDILNFFVPYKHPKNYPLKMVYHALKGFDFLFLENMFRRQDLVFSFWKLFNYNNTVSTIDLARSMGFTKNSLDEWARRINFNLVHHNARSDRDCCFEVYKCLETTKKEQSMTSLHISGAEEKGSSFISPPGRGRPKSSVKSSKGRTKKELTPSLL